MNIGIGLPAAVPDADMTLLGRWARAAEEAGFASVGVIDRLMYDNLDPLAALAAAAVCTSRVELMSTVINVCWRNNPNLLAKQLESVDRLSGARLIAGLRLGGWPADYAASDVPLAGRGARFDAALDILRRRWESSVDDRPRVAIGGLVSASFLRAASGLSDGWVAPLFGLEVLVDGAAAVRRAWVQAGRGGSPRIITGRYFCLGANADAVADAYIRHYYGSDYFAPARDSTLTSRSQIDAELGRLSNAGCTDVLLFPCSAELEQVSLLAAAITQGVLV
jgi:alkanesulfonate monooxygenase SsuD/methylene tetrahydromethanopterin reductase-like flavin-dependent oxidoreductase (luciferase family)